MPPDPAGHADEYDPAVELRATTRRLRAALLATFILFALSATELLPTGSVGRLCAQAALCTPIVFVCGWPLLTRAWRSVRRRTADTSMLTGIGIIAAYAYSLAAVAYAVSGVSPLAQQHDAKAIAEVGTVVVGEVEQFVPYQRGTVEPFFESAAAIVVFALLGQVLELRARGRAGEAVRKLIRLAPKTARVVRPDGSEEVVALEQVEIGAEIRVQPGERFPADGVVLDGTTAVDESILTGEPTWAEKGPGLRVSAGTANGLGAVTVRVTGVMAETEFAKIAEMVGRAQRSRTDLQRTPDRVARWFVPAVLLVAAATFAGWWAFGPPGTALTYAAVCAVGVLIVSCPSALGLAAPAAVVVGMGRAAKAGVVIRDAAALERLAAVDTVLFDKTGTLTEGRPKIVAVQSNFGLEPDEVLALAAAVERGSVHPLGLAIVWEAARRGLDIRPAEGVEGFAGKGIRGTVAGRKVIVGRLGFLQESGAHHDLMHSDGASHRARGHGVTFVGRDDRCVGLVAVADPLRPTAREAVERLRADGLRLILVTGDDPETARAVAVALRIEEVEADVLPAGKFAAVQRLRNDGRVVAMCGDGINDAPALAAADVGVAMGTGTGVAITAAGITLVRSDLRALGPAWELSRATVRTIRQNLILAFVFNALAVPVAAGLLVPLGGGLLSPTWAAAAMCLSSLGVIANSLRLHARFGSRSRGAEISQTKA